jgi:hypothetical protein
MDQSPKYFFVPFPFRTPIGLKGGSGVRGKAGQGGPISLIPFCVISHVPEKKGEKITRKKPLLLPCRPA